MIRTIFAGLWVRVFAGLAAIFALGFITQTIRIEGFWFVVGFKEENAILRLDLTAIKTASEQSARLAEATKAKEQAQYSQLAERADNAERQISGLRAAADRYARANRVRGQTAGGSSSGPGGTSAGEATTRGDGPGGDAVILSRSDFETLNENTVRLVKINRWGEDLIAAGLAER